MELVVDVGNSETVLGIVDPGTLDLRAHWRVSTRIPRTPDEYELLLRSLLREGRISHDDLTMAVLGSVVPSATRILTETLEKIVGEAPIVVDAQSPLPIRLDVDEPLTVGADRIVNTLAAKEMYGRDTIAVDLGPPPRSTASRPKASSSGCDRPGSGVGLEWLGRKTAKLPRVELTPPESVIGRRTEACIQSGVFFSAVDAVDGIVRRILEEWQREEVYVVATGGYATTVGPHARTVDHIEPFLTLFGLALAGRSIRG